MTRQEAEKIAAAYWEEARGKTKKDVDALAKKFTQLLRERHQAQAGERIIEHLSRIRDTAEKRATVTVRSAKKLTRQDRERIAKEVQRAGAYKAVEVINTIDPALIAGWEITIGWDKISNTIHGRLMSIKRQLLS